MRRLSVICCVFVCSSALAGDKDPGAEHESAMKAARRRAGQAQRNLEKLVQTVETDFPAFRTLQEAYRACEAEKKAMDEKIRETLQTSDAYKTLQEERRQIDAGRKAARQAGDKKKEQALGKKRHQNQVKTEALKMQLAPEAVSRSKELSQKIRSIRDKLVRLAKTELRTHEKMKPEIEALEQAKKDEATHRAAMLKARGQVTPLEYLAMQKPPRFKAGHTLPPLTRYGWSQPVELKKAFADHWGYAVALDGYITDKIVARLKDPESNEAKVMALVQSDPKKYKLSVICARHFPKNNEVPEGTWTRDADGKLLSATAKSYDGTEWHPGMKTVISPLAPDALWAECARGRAGPLAAVRKLVPISIVLNGGEYGLGVWGFAGKVWKKDPRVMKAIEADGGDWFAYISKRKAHGEMIIADVVRKAVPDRTLYIYYTCSGCGHRNRYGGWNGWAFDFNTTENPAYELLPEELKDQVEKKKDQVVLKMGRPVRVLARQHKTKAECLVVAWAADNKEQEITVQVPAFGTVKLLARPAGSVYRVTQGDGGPQVHLFDKEPDFPSLSFRE